MILERRLKNNVFKLTYADDGVKPRFFLTEREGVTVAEAEFSFDKPTSPKKMRLSLSVALSDVCGVWSQQTGLNRNLPPDWGEACFAARASSSIPLICLLSSNDENRLTVYVEDCETPCAVSAGFCEETCETVLGVTFFAGVVQPLTTYKTRVFFDFSKRFFGDCVKDAITAYEKTFSPAVVPKEAKDSVFSTWYCYHQNLNGAKLLADCKQAKRLGIDTVIIDDGWQTSDSSRGYGYCGDYSVATDKIPDMRALTGALHDLNMSVMLWFSTSFLGDYAKSTPLLKDKTLYHNDGSCCYVLDPRYSVVRRHIVDRLKQALELWNFDGLKLDFIDAFVLKNTEPPKGADCKTLEEGIKKLLDYLSEELKTVKPNVLIEFRQGYVGPAMRTLCNMLRVGDCPGSMLINRTGVVDLRLTSGGTAVHCDPLIWSKTATAEEVGRCFANVLFSVAQISVSPSEMTEEQKSVTAHYVAFMKKYRKVLLESEFSFKNALLNYTEVSAYDKDTKISGVYADVTVLLNKTTEIIVNGTAENFVMTESFSRYAYTVYDACGNKRGKGTTARVKRIEVPSGGSAVFSLKTYKKK